MPISCINLLQQPLFGNRMVVKICCFACHCGNVKKMAQEGDKTAVVISECIDKTGDRTGSTRCPDRPSSSARKSLLGDNSV